ncbi:MAG TPA: hypothetical protein VLI04_05425 [Nocardioidaceae bacterium]|nr:hypothetical protein [Nocardioidaceae bacterium]
MEATLLLANSAESHAQSGMVNALGLGWSVTGTPTPPAALVLMVKVPWDQTNIRHKVELELVDQDGHPATINDQGGTVRVDGSFEAGRPAGIIPGTPIDTTLVINLSPGMALTAGAAYQWRVEIDGEVVASRSFQVRR